jgi:hypothetical protein
MTNQLANWRIDNFIRELETKKAKGRILPFVRGLRFSSLLTYAIREILSDTGSDLEANWGHLLDEDGTLCSPECDIIIHHSGHVKRWNGSENPITDFRFVNPQKAVAVISCKSYLESNKVDKKYCELINPFVQKVWLFSECCGPRSSNSIKSKALESGYDKFWNLYFWSKKTSPQPNKEGWIL